MLVSFSLLLMAFRTIFPLMASFINHHVHTLRSRMVSLKGNCDIYLSLLSSVLHGDSPFHIVYPHQDPFPLTPRVFGCVCFIHYLGPGRDKLDPRSELCVFLGYSRTQKGYRCYSPRLRRWYVSADVTFFESEPFFGSSSGPSHVRSEPEVDHPPTTVQYKHRPQHARPSHTEKSSSQAEIFLPPHQVSDSPIAFRTHYHSTAHPLSNFVSYDRLTLPFKSFVLSMSSVVLPQSLDEALLHSGWRAAMDLEIGALQSNNTWDLVSLFAGARPVAAPTDPNVKLVPKEGDLLTDSGR
ncbi:uncharacterized protein LOC143885286 [Tasmannia lanceolata]|uniref:uncharacterized protein LOC143885286 n=1 Tax=Tasmannia lanceolata TaxID=3420 RepID=UPI004063C95B